MAEKVVQLYYLGGFSKEGTIIVTAKGKSFVVPPAGQHLTVAANIARDLIRRNRNPQGISVFTTNKDLVKAVMAGRSAAPAMEQPKLSREKLLELLAELDEEVTEDTAPKRNKRKNDETESEAA